MTTDEAKKLLAEFEQQAQTLYEIARTAARNNKSLSGNNFYADRFHKGLVTLTTTELQLKNILKACKLNDDDVAELDRHISVIKSEGATPTARKKAGQQIHLIIQAKVIPEIENIQADPTPRTEQVLPSSVVKGTRGYIERIIQQANGCYERRWFDACMVMLRKFVEILIIEVYVAHNKADSIKDANDDFFMLRGLITKILADFPNLNRDTRKLLPEIKSYGDRSAHNPRYLATKEDVDNLIPGLRVLADDLLYLANLK